jgi:transcriptional regulator with XRE-family HTH domain
MVSPAGVVSSETFYGLVLQLRGRIGLTQRELAARLDVHVHSVQGWEAGTSYPGATSLQRLIAVGVRAGGFTAGREAAEAAALWAAAQLEAPRLRTPFDSAWFDDLPRAAGGPIEGVAGAPAGPGDPIEATRVTPIRHRRLLWGEAPDVVNFVGREAERELLRRWVVDDGCRVAAVHGLGGIGKTLLVTRVAEDQAPAFERVFWRSLRGAPSLMQWLTGAIALLAPGDALPSGGEAAYLGRLLELLRAARCLLVLDNVETILQSGGLVGEYRPGYEGYGALLRQLGETPHRSCLLLTSRELPPELGPLRGALGPVRVLELAGLDVEAARALLRDRQLDGDETAWHALVRQYGGNGLALKEVGETIRELFGGSITAYLEYVAPSPSMMIGGVRRLFAEQLERLSSPEQWLLRRLAMDREPVTFTALASALGPRFGRGAILEAVAGLRRRSLLERGERTPSLSLPSVVMEYVTEQLLEEAAQDQRASARCA